MEVPVDRLVTALAAVFAFLWLAFRIHIAWRIEQRHRREERSEVERLFRAAEMLGRKRAREAIQQASESR